MKKFLSLLLALVISASLTTAPGIAGTTHFENVAVEGDVSVGDDLSVAGDLAVTGDISVDDLAIGDDLTVAGDAAVTGTLGVTGAVSLTVPLTAANINTAIKRQLIPVTFGGGSTHADGATYIVSIPMRRAGTIKAIAISAATRMVGGTNTLAIAKKQGGTSVTVLSTATVDPTAVPTAADTAEALTLTATGADLIFAAGDVIKCTLTCGTMTTDGVGYSLAIDVEYTDV